MPSIMWVAISSLVKLVQWSNNLGWRQSVAQREMSCIKIVGIFLVNFGTNHPFYGKYSLQSEENRHKIFCFRRRKPTMLFTTGAESR